MSHILGSRTCTTTLTTQQYCFVSDGLFKLFLQLVQRLIKAYWSCGRQYNIGIFRNDKDPTSGSNTLCLQGECPRWICSYPRECQHSGSERTTQHSKWKPKILSRRNPAGCKSKIESRPISLWTLPVISAGNSLPHDFSGTQNKLGPCSWTAPLDPAPWWRWKRNE